MADLKPFIIKAGNGRRYQVLAETAEDANARLEKRFVKEAMKEYHALPLWQKMATTLDDHVRRYVDSASYGGADLAIGNMKGGFENNEAGFVDYNPETASKAVQAERWDTAQAKRRTGMAGIPTDMLGYITPSRWIPSATAHAMESFGGKKIAKTLAGGTVSAAEGGVYGAVNSLLHGESPLEGGQLGAIGGVLGQAAGSGIDKVVNLGSGVLSKIGLMTKGAAKAAKEAVRSKVPRIVDLGPEDAAAAGRTRAGGEAPSAATTPKVVVTPPPAATPSPVPPPSVLATPAAAPPKPKAPAGKAKKVEAPVEPPKAAPPDPAKIQKLAQEAATAREKAAKLQQEADDFSLTIGDVKGQQARRNHTMKTDEMMKKAKEAKLKADRLTKQASEAAAPISAKAKVAPKAVDAPKPAAGVPNAKPKGPLADQLRESLAEPASVAAPTAAAQPRIARSVSGSRPGGGKTAKPGRTPIDERAEAIADLKNSLVSAERTAKGPKSRGRDEARSTEIEGILSSPKRSAAFTPEEKAAMERVVRSDPSGRLGRAASKLPAWQTVVGSGVGGAMLSYAMNPFIGAATTIGPPVAHYLGRALKGASSDKAIEELWRVVNKVTKPESFLPPKAKQDAISAIRGLSLSLDPANITDKWTYR